MGEPLAMFLTIQLLSFLSHYTTFLSPYRWRTLIESAIKTNAD